MAVRDKTAGETVAIRDKIAGEGVAVRDKLPEKVWLFVIILPEARLYLKPQTELTNLLSIHTRGGEEGPPGGGGGGGMFEVNVSAGGLPEVVECSR